MLEGRDTIDASRLRYVDDGLDGSELKKSDTRRENVVKIGFGGMRREDV